MKDREVYIDNGWVHQNPAYRALAKIGYSVGGYIDKGVARYVLYRVDTGNHYERIHEFDTAEELNNMVKLLLPPGGE